MKSWLIAKSNLRKFKGLTICLTLLILIASMFITVITLLQTDYKNNADKNAKKLNAADVCFIFYDELDQNEMKNLFSEDVKDYYIYPSLTTTAKYKFNDAELDSDLVFKKTDTFDRTISKIEMVKETKTNYDNFIYLPYQFYSGGGIRLGEEYKIVISNATYTFKVKGFFNSTYGACYNGGYSNCYISDEMYARLQSEYPDMSSTDVFVNFKKGTNVKYSCDKFLSDCKNTFDTNGSYLTKEDAKDSRTFFADIFFVMFVIVTVISVLIVLLSIVNNISNYIKENMKSLGILKAIGYTNGDIKKGLFLQFGIITAVGVIAGILGGYLVMPIITNILVQQSGLPYTAGFDFAATITPIIIIPLFISIVLVLSLLKIKKVEAVEALRDGNSSHLFKKNAFPLEKSKVNLNIALSLKNIANTLKQNIISFITIIFLAIMMTNAIVFYENFSRNPKLELMTMEICDGAIAVKSEKQDELFEYMITDTRLENVRKGTAQSVYDNEYGSFYCFAFDDTAKLNNKESCYKGRYPKYDNEIALSGKYAKDKHIKIGQEIELSSYYKQKYIVTGYIQTTNNNGYESMMTYDGLQRLEKTKLDYTIYFETNAKIKDVLNDYSDKYGDDIVAKVDFQEIVDAQLQTFVNTGTLIVIIISIITGVIIILVLYLLLKSLIYKKRYEYGILKALGFTSKQLIVQTIMSFMPVIIISAIVGTFLSYFTVNPFFTFGMNSFGIMRCDMNIPVGFLVLSSIFLMVMSLIAILLMSKKIRKIEPYKLLIEE